VSDRRRRPTPAEVAAARDRTLPDVIAPELRVLFCGINPSLYSAAAGHHFARPGNRFWKALHAAGFTERLLDPSEDRDLLERGLGVTNLVRRATANAAELGDDDLRRGARRLAATVRRTKPQLVAFCGIDAYRVAFGRPATTVGPQAERLAGARVWVLPNPSGLNAHYQLPDLAAAFRRLRVAAGVPAAGRRPSITSR
jgi:TDG/mug DNA glycosylase family protein